MHWDEIEGKWNELAGSARAHWPQLTEDDWNAITGKKEQLAARIQQRYAMEPREAEKQVEKWARALVETVSVSKAK